MNPWGLVCGGLCGRALGGPITCWLDGSWGLPVRTMRNSPPPLSMSKPRELACRVSPFSPWSCLAGWYKLTALFVQIMGTTANQKGAEGSMVPMCLQDPFSAVTCPRTCVRAVESKHFISADEGCLSALWFWGKGGEGTVGCGGWAPMDGPRMLTMGGGGGGDNWCVWVAPGHWSS